MQYDIYSRYDVSTDDDIYFLGLYSEFDKQKETMPQIKYESNNSEGMIALRDEFQIEDISECSDDIKKIATLKRKTVDLTFFSGKEIEEHKYDGLLPKEIIDVAKQDGYMLNCRYKTYIFTMFALAAGLKARMISCLSMDLRYIGCHWVTEVFSRTYNKWIVVDVPMDYFYFDTKGIPLNLLEMRHKIAVGDKIKIFSTNIEHIQFTQAYWKKNIFRFKFLSVNELDFFRRQEQKYYCLNPNKFTMKDKTYFLNEKKISCNYFYNDFGIWEGLYE